MQKTFILFSGPPAVGKLTLAQKIAEQQSDIVIVHNHLTLNFALQFFPIGSTLLPETHNAIRMLLLENLMKDNRNIVMTLCYDPRKHEAYVKKIQQRVQEKDYKLVYIHIFADKDTLLQRVTSEERKKEKKLQNHEDLEYFLNIADVMEKIPFLPGLSIDTSHLSVQETMEKIQTYYSHMKV